jgi:type IV fimbrial biogenesis protein FimT
MTPGTPALLGPWQRPAGFTLIELLVTVVVLTILLGLAVPAFRTFMQNDQQWVQQNNLVLGVNTARSEAIKNDFPGIPTMPGGAQICSSNTGVACTGTAWDQGWIVRGVDPANPQNPPKTLQVVGALPAGTTLTEANNNLTITFLSNGTLNTGALVNPAARPPVAFKMCDPRGATYARYLQVNLMGRVVASPVVGQDLTGAALTCP